ncbi:MAG TPA: M23 family metallopeptidase [Gemmatimonadales bacterium]|jgi:hypothetical protein
MLFVVWVPLVLQLALPLGLLAWLTLGRPPSRLSWALRAILVALYLAIIAIAGLWLVLPWYTPRLFAAGLLVALVISGRRRLNPRQVIAASSGASGRLALTAGVVACAVLLAVVVRGSISAADTVDLSFPLSRGTYLVVNGGSSELLNAHLKTLSDQRFRAWRGQSYGVDIEKVGALGFRASGILPHHPASYAIFGDPIHAPCTGRVLMAVDGVPEMPPPEMDRRHMAGNHVILVCDTVWVVLGHMRQGSLAVRAGDSAAVGDLLGQVGNTGNTGEPHLHIHAQRSGVFNAPLSGAPLWIRFGDIYPSRNTRIIRNSR